MIEMFVSFLVLMNMSDQDVILFTDDAVHSFIEYEFHNNVQSLRTILRTRKGDCSDYATLMTAIYKEYNLQTEYRIVNGYIGWYKRGKLIKERHDWIEYKIDGEWVNFEPYEYVRKRGYGYW